MRRLCVGLLVAAAYAAATATAAAAPSIVVECNGSPTCEGPDVWFRSPVFVDWTVSGGTPTAGCQDITIDRDTAGNPQGCSATGGGTSAVTVTIKLDRTPPVVTDAAPDRPPDHAGWYTHPVEFTAHGSDATSGVAACVAPGYGGPDAFNATFVGTCRDVAGNVASRAFALSYDATPPDLAAAAITAADRVVRLSWPVGGTATIVRTPGLDGAPSSIVYDGPGTGFIDREVRNERRYRYALTLSDPAGNAASRDLAATPRPRLLGPDKRALVIAPPLLRWTPVRGARYYNVQLFRRGRKILSAWPYRSQLQLRQTWRYRGRRFRLTDGLYHWYVWPGFGPRSERRYGERIGARTFVISRP
jgi:hypothetical protein